MSKDRKERNAAKAKLEEFFRSRQTQEEKNFHAESEKSSGMSSGYVASQTDHKYMLKGFKITAQNLTDQDNQDRADNVREFVAHTMYQLLIYDRAPKEGLVVSSDEQKLYVRSQFYDNAETLATFSPRSLSPNPTKIGPNSKLKDLDGFEKIVAACHIMGEIDWHAGNLMVLHDKKIVKIDHGRSFVSFPHNFATMMKQTEGFMNQVGYTQAIAKGSLSFDLDQYSDYLNQMLKRLNDDQIEAIVYQKLEELKKVNFDPNGLNFTVDTGKGTESVRITNYEDLGRFFKDSMKSHLKIMNEIATQVSIVAKLDISPENRANWVSYLVEEKCENPILFAIQNGMKIDSKDPLEWLYEKELSDAAKTQGGTIKKTVTFHELQKLYDLTKDSDYDTMFKILGFAEDMGIETSENNGVLTFKKKPKEASQTVTTESPTPEERTPIDTSTTTSSEETHEAADQQQSDTQRKDNTNLGSPSQESRMVAALRQRTHAAQIENICDVNTPTQSKMVASLHQSIRDVQENITINTPTEGKMAGSLRRIIHDAQENTIATATAVVESLCKDPIPARPPESRKECPTKTRTSRIQRRSNGIL